MRKRGIHTPKLSFLIHGLPYSFLESIAENWELNNENLKAREAIINIKVANELAERGVKLMEEYNKILTNDEDQKQNILQIMVKKYRSALPGKNKKKKRLSH